MAAIKIVFLNCMTDLPVLVDACVTPRRPARSNRRLANPGTSTRFIGVPGALDGEPAQRAASPGMNQE
jgi:hypothetical protein